MPESGVPAITPPTAEDQVKFLMNLQRFLAEGHFVATYKYALLLALADISIESGVAASWGKCRVAKAGLHHGLHRSSRGGPGSA